jgi:hypothetical protein
VKWDSAASDSVEAAETISLGGGLRLTHASSLEVSVSYTLSGTAVLTGAGQDVDVPTDAIVFAIGDTYKDVSFDVLQDSTFENADETLIATISTVVNGASTAPTVFTHTIYDGSFCCLM